VTGVRGAVLKPLVGAMDAASRVAEGVAASSAAADEQMLLASLQARHSGFDLARLPALIDGLGLAPHWHKPMYMLSTGSRRKVGLAAAFTAGAALTLLDEPFAALDRPSINFVLGLLQAAARDRVRAWVLADCEAPPSLTLACVLELSD
jgi:ATPase subunit of ABC transporter with duplicated ATPase domains